MIIKCHDVCLKSSGVKGCEKGANYYQFYVVYENYILCLGSFQNTSVTTCSSVMMWIGMKDRAPQDLQSTKIPDNQSGAVVHSNRINMHIVSVSSMTCNIFWIVQNK